MRIKKNFIHQNEGFVCEHCSFENPAHPNSCRNHCRQCLYSKHVDQDVPGDRLSPCAGLMKPIGIDYSGKKGQLILHQCCRCKKRMKNKIAEDDDQGELIKLGLEMLKK